MQEFDSTLENVVHEPGFDTLLDDIDYYFREFNRIIECKSVDSVPYLLEILKESEMEDLIRLEALFTLKALIPFADQNEIAYIEAEIKLFDERLVEILKNI
ncbi:MAG: hypothetical protein ACFFD4_06365 [Candidatus Odinarchaeota archaeon]